MDALLGSRQWLKTELKVIILVLMVKRLGWHNSLVGAVVANKGREGVRMNLGCPEFQHN